jgi:transposase-like protein
LYHNPLKEGWEYKRAGYFRRQISPKRIQRFTCKHCNRSFSTQTFSTDYWLKKPEYFKELITKVTGCMANRQIGRDLKGSPATMDRQISRLARHCSLFLWKMMKDLPPPTEIVVDGFESFEFSQYFPIHHHLAVEKGTDFVRYCTDSPLRRKGRMTEAQKNRREFLELTQGKPDPKAIEKDMKELLEVTLKGALSAVVYSDDHPAYKRSIKQVDCDVRHDITPGSACRNQHNSLSEVNVLDALIRHSSSNHKRETIAWSKRRQGSAERLLIFLVWRNYMKGRREKERGSPTPAMLKGLTDHPLTVEEVLSQRIFRSQVDLPPRWAEYYDRAVETPAIGKNTKHELKYAY